MMLFSTLYVSGQSSYDQSVFRVKFEKSSESYLRGMNVRLNANGVIQTGLNKVDLMNEKHQVVSMKRVFPYAGKFEAKHRKYGLDLWYEIEIKKGADIDDARQDFFALNEISTSEFIHAKTSRAVEAASFNSTLAMATLPDGVDDPRYAEQWHYENTGQTGGKVDADIDLDNAWLLETGSTDVIVSIHDEGVDYDHEDLVGNMWVNTGEIANNGIDDDNNGFVDDVYGYNFAQVQGEITPGNHGTHVAGTVAAESNNGIGGSGVAGGTGSDDGVRLMSCQVFSGTGSRGFSSSYVYAADNGAVISQNSWGYTVPGSYEQSVLDAIRYFIAEAGYDESGTQVGPMAGGIVIFAAGNDADNDAYYPGYMEEVIAVGGTNHTDYKFYASNYGPWVDIAAPGEDIFSSLINDGYTGTYSGTSMACPHVSGVAALIVSRFKEEGITPDLVRSRLLNTTDPLTFDGAENWGTGRVNAYKALADDDGAAPVAITDFQMDAITDLTASFSWTAPADMPNSTQVTYYDLRYSTQPINASNFGEATPANVKKPSSPGTTEEIILEGLLPATTYYFAIVSSDYFGNTSSLSTVLSGTTEDAPTIAIAGDPSVTIDLSTDTKTALGSFTITNEGAYPLYFDILPTYGGIAEYEVETSLLYGGVGVSPGLPLVHYAGDYQSFQNQSINTGSSIGAQLNFANQEQDVLAYDDGDDEVAGALKVTNQSGEYNSWISATNFEVPEQEGHFLLSQVTTYMQVSYEAAGMETTLMIIEGGETPADGTVRLSQVFEHKESSQFLNIPLEIPLPFESGDEFWVVFLLPEERVEFGYDIVEGGNRPNTHMAFMNNQWTDIQSFEGYENYVWTVRAIEKSVDGLSLDVVQGEIAPLSSQHIEVSYDGAEVVRNATYDFELKIISNDPVNPVTVVDAQATIIGLLEPEMEVTPANIETIIDASVSTTAVETITITNTGDGDLIFDFENQVEVPEVSIAAVTSYTSLLDVPVSAGVAPHVSTTLDTTVPVAKYGEGSLAYGHQIHPDEFFVTFSTDAPGEYATQGEGIGYNVIAADFTRGDVTNMYIINDESETLMKMNLETGERSVIGATAPFNDIATDKFENVVYGTYFNGYTSDLYTMDVSTGAVELVGSMGDGIMVAIACDGEGQMWGYKLDDGNIYSIDKASGAATAIGHVGFTGNYNQSLAWDPKTDMIYLAAYNYIEERGEFRVVDTQTGATELIGVFPNNSQVSALAFAGGGYVDFASVSPTNGTVAPGASMDVQVTIDAMELPNGDYYTPLSISTNDYDHLTQVVPVALEVTGQIGELSVDHQVLDFGSVLLGADKELEIKMSNRGIGTLDIESITSTSDLFTTNLDGPVVIDMNGDHTVKINFKPDEIGQFNSSMSIQSNDPNSPVTKITLTGSAILPPEVVIAPDTIMLSLNSGEIVTRQFTIKNEGAYPLQYSIPENQSGILSEEQVALNSLGGPDDAGYRWIDSNDSNGPEFVWNDISTSGTEIMSGAYTGSEFVELPFDFPFYGETKTSMYISAEGFVTFASTGSTTNYNRAIPNAYTPNDLVAGYWDNLRFPNTVGNMYYEAFEDRIIVQWEKVGNSNNNDGTISFQIVLFDDGRIMYYYEQASLGIKNSATIGIENADGTQGLQINYNETFVEDELAILVFPGYQGFDNVSINKYNGIIPAGEEETIEATIDATGLLEGVYSHEIYIYNNDPLVPKAQFTAVLDVIGHPEITANTESLTFAPIIDGTSVIQSLSLKNTGSKDLVVSSIASSDEAFTTSFVEELTLAAGQQVFVEVTFAPVDVGVFTGDLTVTSDDDFGNSSLVIPVSGSTIASPELRVTTDIDPVEVSLASSESDKVSVTVENISGSVLNYVVHAPSFMTLDGVTTPSVVQGGDNFGYTWADSDSSDAVIYDWVDIAESGNRLALGEGDGIFVSLPFTFPYYGNTYDEVQIASNGFLTFNTTLGASGGQSNRSFPSTIDPDNHIAIFWDDLDPEEMGDVYYLATPDSLVVQYTNVSRDNSAYGATFQGILYANGDIKMQYKDLEAYTAINSVSVGMENEDGTDGLTVVYNKLDYLKSEFAVMITSPYYKGVLEAGLSESFDLLIDTDSIYHGVYMEPIRIVSNDTDDQITEITATLNVSGVQEISLSTNEILFDPLHYVEGENFNQIKEFTVYNEGTKDLMISSLTFSDEMAGFGIDKTSSYTVAPKDSLVVKVTFAPDQATDFVNTLTINSDDASNPVLTVSMSGVAVLPPAAVVNPLETLVLDLLSTEVASDAITLTNEGMSDLEYTTEIRFFPYGFSDVSSSVVPSFEDSIYYDKHTDPDGYYGQNGGSVAPKVAVKFTLEKERFYLTHVSNYYNSNGAYEPSLLQVYKGGTRPENGELVTSQQFSHPEAENGYNAIIALEEPQLFYEEEEHFWVVITYPTSMLQPAAYNDRLTSDPRASWYFPGHSWLSDAAHNFKIRALEQVGGYGDWLTVDPAAGTVAPDANTDLTFYLDASETDRGGSHYAMVTYNFNDPLTPSLERAVEVYVNHLPEIDVLENINVQEGSEVSFVAEVSDLDGTITEIALAEEYAFTSLALSGNTATIVYSPDYDQAGVHVIELVATDDKGETVVKPIHLTVANVNRNPVASQVSDMQRYLHEGVLTLEGNTIFSDADMDALTFRAINESDEVATVLTTSTGFEITPVQAGTTFVGLFASDGTVEVLTSFNLTVVENQAPVAVSLENISRYVSDGVYSLVASEIFSDGDHILTFTATVADATVATAAVTASGFDITPLSAGATLVTLTATDGIVEVSTSFTVTVAVRNSAPVAVTVEDATLQAGGTSLTFAASSVFTDADSDVMYFDASAADATVVGVSISSGNFIIEPLAEGSTTVTLTATDTYNDEVTVSFTVSVEEEEEDEEEESTETNAAPVAVTVEDATLQAGGMSLTFAASSVFTDADSDVMYFDASATDAAVVGVSISSGNFIIEPLAEGSTTVTLTATDTYNDVVTVSFTVSVEEEEESTETNTAPVAMTVEDATLHVGGTNLTFAASSVFTDADGDVMYFDASAADAAVVGVSISSGSFIIEPLAEGSTTVTLTATDTYNDEVTVSFTVSVESNILSSIEVERLEMDLYPNPVKNQVNVKWEPGVEATMIRLFDNAGIMIQLIQVPANSSNYTLDMATLQSGVYHMQLITNEQVYTRRVIKE
ncbi:hypothetical protein BFP72_07700 [Reichenbachiella sp. 5M10]|nr:hypothetical protein BFP72_07700 [Reichenbachiella sp. 5M10]